jgi:hypothetical protein
MARIKIATHQCVFGQDKWLLKNIENCYPFVDRIYISYSDLPWNYNPNARNVYKNTTNLEEVKNSIYSDKIEIVYGDWLNETDQRNECVRRASNDGFDILIIQDTDEFYLEEDYQKIIDFINLNPNYDIYRCSWISFWKSLEWVVVDSNLNDVVGLPQIAINLRRGIKFKDRRNPNSNNDITIPDVLCYHLSFVLNDTECIQKLKTWGHAHEFNVDDWFHKNWVNWSPETTNMHPINPSAWHKTIKNKHKLPKQLLDSY